MTASCSFHILNRDRPDESRSLYVHNFNGGGLVLDEVPAVGDLIFLSGTTADPEDSEGERTVKAVGQWRVLARSWLPAMYGSPVWRTGDQPTVPIAVDVMVEPAEGLFAASQYAALGGAS